MANMAEFQRRDFIDRIERIREGGPNTLGTIYAGNVEDGGGAISQPKKKRKRNGGVLKEIAIWPFALIVGFASMLAGRVAAFHLMATPDLVPVEYASLAVLSLDVAIAGFLLLMLAWAFRLGRGMRFVFMTVGLLSVMLGEGLIIDQAPGLFASVFSPEYVSTMQGQVTPLEQSFPQFFDA